MAAGGEVEPHERVAGLHQREEHRLVGLAAGIGLHVGELALEQLAGALDGERLGDVDELAAAVIAPAGIALGVFVRHHRALRLEHGARDDVLRGDQFDSSRCRPSSSSIARAISGIRVAERGGKERIGADRRRGLVHDGPCREDGRAHSTKRGEGGRRAATTRRAEARIPGPLDRRQVPASPAGQARGRAGRASGEGLSESLAVTRGEGRKTRGNNGKQRETRENSRES